MILYTYKQNTPQAGKVAGVADNEIDADELGIFIQDCDAWEGTALSILSEAENTLNHLHTKALTVNETFHWKRAMNIVDYLSP